jgi:hypothetical protein
MPNVENVTVWLERFPTCQAANFIIASRLISSVSRSPDK